MNGYLRGLLLLFIFVVFWMLVIRQFVNNKSGALYVYFLALMLSNVLLLQQNDPLNRSIIIINALHF